MFGKTFFQKRLLPVLQRDLARGRGDAIPERLHVVDLALDRKRVEPRRRQRQGVRHGRNIPPDAEPTAAPTALNGPASFIERPWNRIERGTR